MGIRDVEPKITRGFNSNRQYQKDKIEITDAQREYISAIEEALDVKFEGTTKKEASEFISKYDEEMTELSTTYFMENGRFYDWGS